MGKAARGCGLIFFAAVLLFGFGMTALSHYARNPPEKAVSFMADKASGGAATWERMLDGYEAGPAAFKAHLRYAVKGCVSKHLSRAAPDYVLAYMTEGLAETINLEAGKRSGRYDSRNYSRRRSGTERRMGSHQANVLNRLKNSQHMDREALEGLVSFEDESARVGRCAYRRLQREY